MKEPVLYKILRPIITILIKVFYRPVIIGKENILKSGRLVLAGNHTSYFDCVLLISCTNRVVHFMAKEELSKGLLGLLFRNMGLVFVNRKIKDKNSLNNAISFLKDNKVIGIFPEGTINRTNDVIMPFKYGAVKMCNVSDSYIVPFTITGKYKLFSNNIIIKFEKPYRVSDDLEKENRKLERIISSELIKRS